MGSIGVMGSIAHFLIKTYSLLESVFTKFRYDGIIIEFDQEFDMHVHFHACTLPYIHTQNALKPIYTNRKYIQPQDR